MDRDLISIILVGALIIGGFIWEANALNHYQCKNNVQEMGREYRYDLINGCRIGLDDGTFIYWKMYRENN